MSDVRLRKLAERQYNRVARAQLLALGLSHHAIQHRVDRGALTVVEQGVYALPPVLADPRGAWMGATLTAPDTFVSHASAGAAYGVARDPRGFVVVTRPGSGGRCRHGGLLVCRSTTLDGETTTMDGIPITTPERTLLDLSAWATEKDLARSVREAIRLGHTSLPAIVEALERHRRRRGATKLRGVAARYSGLPLERARSGAEVRALEVLRAAGCVMPDLNRRIAGEEADLSWRRERRIVEIDGRPFHSDVGEDERKAAAWRAAGWSVDRIGSDDVYERPERLLALAP
jgi:hypothetical protein